MEINTFIPFPNSRLQKILNCISKGTPVIFCAQIWPFRSDPSFVELLCRQQKDDAACSYSPVYFPVSDIKPVILSSPSLSSDVKLDGLRGEGEALNQNRKINFRLCI